MHEVAKECDFMRVEALSTPTNPITVLIADEHPLFREGLRTRLQQLDEFKVVGEEQDGRGVIAACKKYMPKVLVIDIFMPEFCGQQIVAKFEEVSPDTRVLIASENTNPIDVQIALSEGASGYILKNASSEEFINAIRVIANDGSYLPQKLMNNLIEAAKKTRSTGNMFGLTVRELDILKELALGSGNKGIARKLNISVRTVETHRQNIRQKTGTFATADLVRIAIRLGLTEEAARGKSQ